MCTRIGFAVCLFRHFAYAHHRNGICGRHQCVHGPSNPRLRTRNKTSGNRAILSGVVGWFLGEYDHRRYPCCYPCDEQTGESRFLYQDGIHCARHHCIANAKDPCVPRSFDRPDTPITEGKIARVFFAWLALWLLRRISRFPNWNLAAVLVLAIVSSALMARAASIGTEIRHVEIQSGQETSGADPGPTLARSWALYVQTHSWVWPTCETLHFIGLSMLFAVVLAVDLRMLGMGKKSLSFAALYQLLPLGMLGFGIKLITGIMFFVSTPQQYVGFLFFLKMMLVVAGAFNVLYFMLLDEPWTVGEGDDASKKTKLVAASAIAIWVGVLFCGHMLPFLGNSF